MSVPMLQQNTCHKDCKRQVFGRSLSNIFHAGTFAAFSDPALYKILNNNNNIIEWPERTRMVRANFR